MRTMIAVSAILLALLLLTRMPGCASVGLAPELRVELAELMATTGLPHGPVTSGFNPSVLTQGQLDELLRAAAGGATIVVAVRSVIVASAELMAFEIVPVIDAGSWSARRTPSWRTARAGRPCTWRPRPGLPRRSACCSNARRTPTPGTTRDARPCITPPWSPPPPRRRC